MKNREELFNRYLEILEIDRAKPSLALLKTIVRSHLIKIPFENISKLIYKKRGMNTIPDMSTFLEGIAKFKFGGTCYSNNYYLYLLLNYLGYDVKLCGADMKNPDVHLITIVKFDDKEFIVDVGYAAPFYNPLPRFLNEDFSVTLGNEKYVVKPANDSGTTRIEQHCDGRLQHWYTAKPSERKIEEFGQVIKDSYSDNATFMNAIRITKFTENGSRVLKNLYFTETVGDDSSVTKIDLENIPIFIMENFGMQLSIVKKAVGHFKNLKDIYD